MNVFDSTIADAQAMLVAPVDPADFDLARYGAHARAADERFGAFLRRREGIAIWQRVRVADVFSAGCRDMRQSLRWQLGALTRSMAYMSDVPAYLEPWYGIGITASAYGSTYQWPEGQSPAVRPHYSTILDATRLTAGQSRHSRIMAHVLAMIAYFLEETQGRVPLSWTDLQSPLSVATQLVDTSSLFMALAACRRGNLGFHSLGQV